MVKKDGKVGIQVIAQDIVLAEQIQILPEAPTIHVTEEELYSPNSFEPFIQLLDAQVEEVLADGQIDLGDAQHLLQSGGENFGLKFLVDAETRNKVASDTFCARIRSNVAEFTNLRFEPNQELDWSFLYTLSERWKLPLVLIKLGSNQLAGHYTLALKRPEQKPDGGWQVLIADPTRPGVRYHDLNDSWQESPGAQNEYIPNSVAGNDNPYDLTFPGDLQTAQNIDLL